METKKFNKSLNAAELYFEVFYVIYIGLLLFRSEFDAAIIVFVVGLVIFGYLLLLRPSSYSVTRKTLIIHKRLGKDKEINLMTCETITDPLPKMTRLITNPHSLEMYFEGKVRVVVSPDKRIDFVDTVISANKRIQVQVKDFAANRKVVKKNNRKDL